MNQARPRTDRPTILFVATDLSTGGGVNKVIRDLAVLFAERLSANVRVVNARSSRPSAYEFPADVLVQMHRRQSLLSYFWLLLKLRRSRPDFVISSWTQDNILVALAFAFSASKVVLVEHSSWHFQKPTVRLLRTIVYRLAWRLVVLNRRDLDHYRKSMREVRLIPNPVAATSEVRGDAPEKLIIAVGHLERLKQFDHAIRAMASSQLENDGWSLTVIGSGSEEPRLHQLIGELGLKRTRIYSNAEDLASIYPRARLLLVTSRAESFSLVLAEAMLSGVIPIAYATDGPSFILEDFPKHLVAIGDVEALSDRLAYFANLTEPEPLRHELRASIEKRFSPNVIAEEWKMLLFGAESAERTS